MGGSVDPVGPQLPLGISLAPGATFEAFFAAANPLTVDLLSSLARDAAERQVWLAGSAGLGKSHLLQATCHHAAAAGQRCAYLPLDGELGRDSAILAGLDRLDLIALDGVSGVAGDAGWERGLFHLVNAVRDGGGRLLFADRDVPDGMAFDLPDLGSRLSWGPVLRLAPLAEADKAAALRERAHALGLDLPQAAADYLLRHYPRDLAGQLAGLERLDRASLASGRRLTVPFIKAVFEQTT